MASEEKMGSLLSKTLELLKIRQKSLPDISQASGLPFYWLRKLNSGEIADPSVNRIQTLYEYLSGRQLIH